ncbi:type I polyketide synthase [Okeania sp. KiyG1]|uniref:type I polyketide synthase n=1 Tax=Okeania sp. KiyG1 TaxID=2720165 RepID=UPI0019C714DE|nr:type I polyketide synthase [Okeania sp. KiyG1]GFZ92567.1 hypothetical protein CYANOKiyG1_03270 [Okeania sp. KiyG1]
MLSSLGQLYVRGYGVDWSGFDRDYTRKKVSLPTYPFQRERYWVETSEDWDAKAISTVKLHPLINQKFQSPLSQEIFFESDFSSENYPFLPDHRIYEKVIVPGASHISFLLGAASLTLPGTVCQLENILFPQALAIPEQGMRKVQVALTPSDSSYTFQFISFDDSLDSPTNGGANHGLASGSWAVHATGKLSAAKIERLQLSLEEIQARCPQNIEGTEIYQHLGERQVQLGPSFRWLEQLWIGEDEVLAQLKVPQTIQDADKYQLHPALIDSCFYSVVALVLNQSDDKNETLVPFSVEKFTFYNLPQPGLLWCYTRRSKDTQSEDQLKADIELFDQHRQLVARVTGFETRKANPKILLMTLRADLSHWFYQINWQAQPLAPTNSSEQNKTGNWLVFCSHSELAELMGNELRKKGDNCIWVSPGSEYKKLEAQHYHINPTVAEQFPQLLQENSEIKGIVHFWGVNESIESVDELETAQELGCAALLHLVQGLLQAGLTVPIWLVTQGTQSVLADTEVVQPQQGSLWGLGRVLRLEHPEFRCYQVDLDPEFPVNEAIPSLVDEMLLGDREDQIAIRQEVRYVARLVRQQQKLGSQQPSELIQPEASYLITGGLGALGLEVAQWMVKEGAKHIVLTGRSDPNETAQQIIQELETAGASVSVLLGDISIAEDVDRVFQQLEASLPPLKGIIHAAGVLDDGVLQNLSWQQFKKVIAPKVQGTWHLHQLTKDLPLDFFVCFSSMTSMLGNLGQGNYAAANGFMDAIIRYRRGMGLPGLSINWGVWATSGMAARLNSLNQKRLESSGISAIKPEQGMQALESLLSDAPSQVGVFPVNWLTFLRELPGGQTMPFLSAFLATEPSLTQKSAFREQLEATPVSERQEFLNTHVRSAIAKTLGLQDIQKIGMRQPLFDFGLDSLMAVQLTNSLESSLQTKLGSTLLFDYPTVEKLLSYISSEVLSVELAGTINEPKIMERKTYNFREEIEQLSEAEAQNLLLLELDKMNI